MAKDKKSRKSRETRCLLSPRKLRIELQRLAIEIESHELDAERIIQLPEPLLVRLDNLMSDVRAEQLAFRQAERKLAQGVVDDW
jgi:hypothetical protein